MTISWFCAIDCQAYGVSEEYYHREPYREGLGEEVDYSFKETLNESDDQNKLISAPGCPE